MKKTYLLVPFVAAFMLASCGSNDKAEQILPSITSEEESISSEETTLSESSEEKSNIVNVFVLAGQSNMEGNTFVNPYLYNYAKDAGKDATGYREGFSNVYTSYYNDYPFGAQCNFSNTVNPMSGLFKKTRAGFGVTGDNYFGPEVGIAEVLNEEIDTDNPIYLIKYTAGGTSFETNPGWISPNGKLYQGLNTYVLNNLELLETMGKIPVLKGFLWMQGESDSGTAAQAGKYEERLLNMVTDFRSNFSDYAVEEDGDKIAFIDAAIYDGPNTAWGQHRTINQAKQNIAALSDYNFYLDTTCATGLALQINSAEHGGGDVFHYTADSMIKLGNGFANVIVENDLLKL